jgi:hypothetical protein
MSTRVGGGDRQPDRDNSLQFDLSKVRFAHDTVKLSRTYRSIQLKYKQSPEIMRTVNELRDLRAKELIAVNPLRDESAYADTDALRHFRNMVETAKVNGDISRAQYTHLTLQSIHLKTKDEVHEFMSKNHIIPKQGGGLIIVSEDRYRQEARNSEMISKWRKISLILSDLLLVLMLPIKIPSPTILTALDRRPSDYNKSSWRIIYSAWAFAMSVLSDLRRSKAVMWSESDVKVRRQVERQKLGRQMSRRNERLAKVEFIHQPIGMNEPVEPTMTTKRENDFYANVVRHGVQVALGKKRAVTHEELLHAFRKFPSEEAEALARSALADIMFRANFQLESGVSATKKNIAARASVQAIATTPTQALPASNLPPHVAHQMGNGAAHLGGARGEVTGIDDVRRPHRPRPVDTPVSSEQDGLTQATLPVRAATSDASSSTFMGGEAVARNLADVNTTTMHCYDEFPPLRKIPSYDVEKVVEDFSYDVPHSFEWYTNTDDPTDLSRCQNPNMTWAHCLDATHRDFLFEIKQKVHSFLIIITALSPILTAFVSTYLEHVWLLCLVCAKILVMLSLSRIFVSPRDKQPYYISYALYHILREQHFLNEVKLYALKSCLCLFPFMPIFVFIAHIGLMIPTIFVVFALMLIQLMAACVCWYAREFYPQKPVRLWKQWSVHLNPILDKQSEDERSFLHRSDPLKANPYLMQVEVHDDVDGLITSGVMDVHAIHASIRPFLGQDHKRYAEYVRITVDNVSNIRSINLPVYRRLEGFQLLEYYVIAVTAGMASRRMYERLN